MTVYVSHLKGEQQKQAIKFNANSMLKKEKRKKESKKEHQKTKSILSLSLS